MTRVYSQSQGKFIDTADTGSTNTTSQSGDSSGDLRQILLMQAINNPKKASQISTILNMLPAPSADDLKKQSAKQLALQNITQLEDLYFSNKLYKGPGLSGIITDFLGPKLQPGGGYGMYKNTVESMKPTFARAAGDVGNLSKAEQEAAAKNFPTARYTRAQAIQRFNEARERFGLPIADYSNYGGVKDTSSYIKKYSQ